MDEMKKLRIPRSDSFIESVYRRCYDLPTKSFGYI